MEKEVIKIETAAQLHEIFGKPGTPEMEELKMRQLVDAIINPREIGIVRVDDGN